MTPVSTGQKYYFAAVAALALWVGVWGYFIPQHVDWALPWLVPPLHARFIGALYLSGAALLIGAMRARNYAEARVVPGLTAIWTGFLLLLSLFHLDEFDFTREPTWFWFGAYIAYPLIGAWLTWTHRGESPRAPGAALPAWGRRFLWAQGALLTALALALMLAPTAMAALWPWKITPLLAQLYSALFLAYGISSLRLRNAQTWPEVQVLVRAEFVFVALALAASLVHRELFESVRIAAWLWFGGLAVFAGVLGTMSVHSCTARTSV